MQNKFIKLKEYLYELAESGVCIAFSGGIDSTLLLYLLKNSDAKAYTFKSVFQSCNEINLTQEICQKFRIQQEIIDFYPLQNELIINNPKDRCYHCKKLMFSMLRSKSCEKNIIDGTNYDDLSSFRPGLKALKELQIISPLAKYKITKAEIREYAKQLNIPNFDKPSTPCLATRFPYGTKLNNKILNLVEEGETILHNAGYNNVRFRLHGDIARIELPKQKFKDFITNDNLQNQLKALGIRYITLDLEGLRPGSMD